MFKVYHHFIFRYWLFGQSDQKRKKSAVLLIYFFQRNDLSFASTETKYIKLKTKTQNNIVIFGFSSKK